MQSPPFRILGINNNNPRHAGNPPPKTAADTGASGQLPPILVTNPSARVGRRGGEGGEGERNKASTRSTKKRASYMGDRAHAALDTTRPSQSDLRLTLMMTAFMWTLHKLCVARQKARERKRRLQQLLLQRSGTLATPIILVAVAPFCQLTLSPVPEGPPSGDHSTHQGVATPNSQEEGDRQGVLDV